MANNPAEDRSWQQIATELSHETNSDKIANLSEELNRALDRDEKRHSAAAA